MRTCVLLFSILAVACVPQHDEISESDVINVVEGFFDAIDVENDNPVLLDSYLTKDFILYEAGKKMNKGEMLEFFASFPIVKSSWELDDFRISIDENSAHVSLFNTGNFTVQTDSMEVQQVFKWLESAYLVKEDNVLKIKFYFSDNISIE
ncbi:DUF4440 domain-containing protein [Carboxylicivirga marina]|uniref:DUF4440 domain-containing protein n=1 Tax=Carboxylicivirga marina TaxID=2800988 RepID=UPI0025915C4C|nr:DUF4440 domain-containing protein [uncultured Carboxylicivirga sp.]